MSTIDRFVPLAFAGVFLLGAMFAAWDVHSLDTVLAVAALAAALALAAMVLDMASAPQPS